jgi:hypothetical protein
MALRAHGGAGSLSEKVALSKESPFMQCINQCLLPPTTVPHRLTEFGIAALACFTVCRCAVTITVVVPLAGFLEVSLDRNNLVCYV